MDLTYTNSFTDACVVLASNRADYALMAVQNTTAGYLAANYKLIVEHNLWIYDEITLPVQFGLWGLPGSRLEEIRKIVSHPVALRQCRRFLNTMPHVLSEEGGDTALCCFTLAKSEQRSLAVIATQRTAELYGLHTLASGIQDEPENYTRFLVLAKGATLAARLKLFTVHGQLLVAPETLRKELEEKQLQAEVVCTANNLAVVECRSVHEISYHEISELLGKYITVSRLLGAGIRKSPSQFLTHSALLS